MDVQTATVVVTGISIIVGIIVFIFSRRQEVETRQAELFMELYREWRSPTFRTAVMRMTYHCTWKDFDEFWQKYGPQTNLQDFVNTFVRQATFYEGVGVLVEQKLIDIKLVDRLMHNTIKSWWERMGPVYRELRTKQAHGEDPHYDSAEQLYPLIEQMGQKRLQTTVST